MKWTPHGYGKKPAPALAPEENQLNEPPAALIGEAWKRSRLWISTLTLRRSEVR